jgi:hypothetical protein
MRASVSWIPAPSRRRLIPLLVAACALAAFARVGATPAPAGANFCHQTSVHALHACQKGARSDYLLTLGKCDNIADPVARKACQQQALAEYKDAKQLCNDQFQAREAVCDGVGEEPYDPVIDPLNFVSVIDNPLYPLTPGTTRTYMADVPEGVKTNVVTTTHNTVVIMGVTCVEVHDTVYINGEVVEDTLDWFAQDKAGNVWYFGENTLSIENGLIVSVEGTFTAGVDNDRPGIIMEASPALGDYFRQEFVLGQGEDVEQIFALDESVSVPYGDFDHCLVIQETTALEPDVIVHDFYAPGIGPIKSVEGPPDEILVLVDVTTE